MEKHICEPATFEQVAESHEITRRDLQVLAISMHMDIPDFYSLAQVDNMLNAAAKLPR